MSNDNNLLNIELGFIAIGIIALIILMFTECAEAFPMLNFKGEKIENLGCKDKAVCEKKIEKTEPTNVTVIVHCADCGKKSAVKKPHVSKKVDTPKEQCKPKIIEKKVEIRVPELIEKRVEYKKKWNVSILAGWGEGGVINYLQKGDSFHEKDYILERDTGFIIGAQLMRRFQNDLTASAILTSSGHGFISIGKDFN